LRFLRWFRDRRASRGERMSSLEEWAPRRLLLGLGNPGERYLGTRHNRGREVVEELARRRQLGFTTFECGAHLALDDTLALAIPDTYMNRSGYAARCLLEAKRLSVDRIMVIYDDISLPLGIIRCRPNGGPGGQKGMASVIENLRTDAVARLRLGILPAAGRDESEDLAAFVLSPFDADELAAAREQIQRAADACETWLSQGCEATMNQFNNAAVPTEVGTDPSEG
jgi:PTH1 family peptidyl-tRNA hydrolase